MIRNDFIYTCICVSIFPLSCIVLLHNMKKTLIQRITFHVSPYVAIICERYLLYLSYICERYLLYLSYICERYLLYVSYICERYLLYLSYTCPILVRDISYTCPLFVRDISYTCPILVLHLSYTCPTLVLYFSYTSPILLLYCLMFYIHWLIHGVFDCCVVSFVTRVYAVLYRLSHGSMASWLLSINQY